MTDVTQKSISRLLDRAAGRSAQPASPKQCWFLAGLIARSETAEIDYQDWLLDSRALSRCMASDLIDGYLGAEKRVA